jgi:hypothetical protein
MDDRVVKSIYIAGGMRGYPLYNFPAFDEAKRILTRLGLRVVSPADHDRELGFNPTEDMDVSKHPEKNVLDIGEVLLWDLTQVKECDALYMLKGWDKSQGARLEHDFGRALGKKIMFEEEGMAQFLAEFCV